MYVFVIDENRHPLNPVSPHEADTLLKTGKAAIFRQYPKTIILKTSTIAETGNYRLKIYPGTSMTGIAILNEDSHQPIFAAQIEHRGQDIKQKLQFRAKCRRRRRNANLRYRQPRFSNRKASNPVCRTCGSNAVHSLGYCRTCHSTLQKGEINFAVMGAKPLFPSVESRCQNIFTWVKKFTRLCPIKGISFELKRYDPTHIYAWVHDTSLDPELKKAYFYELRDFLHRKWKKSCSLCGTKGVNLRIDALIQGRKAVDNYILGCPTCLEKLKKSTSEEKKSLVEHLKLDSESANMHEKVIHLSRNRILCLIRELAIPVEVCTGGVTSLNRKNLGLKNYSWQKALCVGTSTPKEVQVDALNSILNVKSMGHGSRKMCTGYRRNDRINPVTGQKFTPRECGFFPMNHRPKGDPRKNYFGFKIGDVVKFQDLNSFREEGDSPLNIGTVLQTWGNGKITVLDGKKKMKVDYEKCEILQHSDGYCYSLRKIY